MARLNYVELPVQNVAAARSFYDSARTCASPSPALAPLPQCERAAKHKEGVLCEVGLDGGSERGRAVGKNAVFCAPRRASRPRARR